MANRYLSESAARNALLNDKYVSSLEDYAILSEASDETNSNNYGESDCEDDWSAFPESPSIGMSNISRITDGTMGQ